MRSRGESDLLPCPFDGGRAIFTENSEGYPVIGCTLCEVELYCGWFEQREKAIDHWNRRTTEGPKT